LGFESLPGSRDSAGDGDGRADAVRMVFRYGGHRRVVRVAVAARFRERMDRNARISCICVHEHGS
jgi:hypothetical protein